MSKSRILFIKMAEDNYTTTGRNASSVSVGCIRCYASQGCFCDTLSALTTKIGEYHQEIKLDSLLELGILKLDPRVDRTSESGLKSLRQSSTNSLF